MLGRPNVGKSSLLNALLGQERLIVSDVPGTTRDAIDTVLATDDRTFVLVDTAGLRRKRRQRQGIEYYSELRALEAANRADIALVLIDASEGVVEQDLTVADVARKAQCSTLVVLSKWDETTVAIEDVRRSSRRGCASGRPYLRRRPRPAAGSRACSSGSAQLYDKHAARLSTPELNRFLAELREDREPPSRRGKRLNLLYGTQTSTRPPRYRFFVNDPGARDAGLRVLGREPHARPVLARGRAGLDRLRPTRRRLPRAGGRRRSGFLGHGVRQAARGARTRDDARLPGSRAGADDRGHRPEPALFSRPSPSTASRRAARRRTPRRRRPRGRRSPEQGVRGGRPRPSRHLPSAQPDEGARSGDRRAALDARRAPGRVACLSGPNIAEEVAPRPAFCDGDRERGRGAGGLAPGDDQLADLPRLRQHGHRRRRVLRRGEERDRARGRRGRRSWARRQREGEPDHARRHGDGPAGRGGRGAHRDVRGARRDGRSDGHLLEQARA